MAVAEIKVGYLPAKHGMYTKAAIEERKWLNELIKEANQVASQISE